MAVDFRVDDAPANVNVAAWLTILNGVLGTLGAIPFGSMAPAGAGLSVLSGLAGMGGGIASLLADSPGYEPTFKAWADLSKSFGDSLERAMGAFSEYYTLTLASRPAAGDREAVDALTKAIGAGSFASYNNGPVEFDSEVLKKMLRASIISAMWNQQKIIAVRWTGTLRFAERDLDPCAGKEDDLLDELKNSAYCADGVNYMTVRTSPPTTTQPLSRPLFLLGDGRMLAPTVCFLDCRGPVGMPRCPQNTDAKMFLLLVTLDFRCREVNRGRLGLGPGHAQELRLHARRGAQERLGDPEPR